MRLRCLAGALILVAAFASDSWGQSKQPSAKAGQQSAGQQERGTNNSPVVVKVIPTEKSKDELAREDAKDKEKLAVDYRPPTFPYLWRLRGRAHPWIFRLELPLRRPENYWFLVLVDRRFAGLPWRMVALTAPTNPMRMPPLGLMHPLGSEASCALNRRPENVVVHRL